MIHSKDKYTGQMDQQGKACGEGILLYTSGAAYEGQFKDNKRHGLGK